MPFLSGTKFDDPRPELKKLRRGTLKRACRENGLEFDEATMGADDLRRLVSSNNIDMTPYLPEAHQLGQREAPSKRISEMEKREQAQADRIADLEQKVMSLLEIQGKSAEKAAEKDVIPESFEGLPIWRLRQLCKTMEIPSQKTDKSADLIRKLNEHTAERTE